MCCVLLNLDKLFIFPHIFVGFLLLVVHFRLAPPLRRAPLTHTQFVTTELTHTQFAHTHTLDILYIDPMGTESLHVHLD